MRMAHQVTISLQYPTRSGGYVRRIANTLIYTMRARHKKEANMELCVLCYFLAVAREQNISTAAATRDGLFISTDLHRLDMM